MKENGVRIIRRKDNPSISVIIPSLDGYREGNVPRLLEALSKQTFQDFEVIVVKGIKPTSRAHNIGVQNASTETIVFFDDDIVLGNNNVINNLIKPVIKDGSIGITGASQLIPADANRFQKKCGNEFNRSEFPIVSKMVESDMATHAAMAIRKNVFMEIGQENENIIYGDDPDLRHRVRQVGYKIVIIPNTWIYHSPPKNITIFLKTSFKRGYGAAHDFWYYPDSAYETPPANTTTFIPRRTFLYRIFRFFVLNVNAIVNLKLIFLSVRISYGLGYVTGLSKEMIGIISPHTDKH
jgi:GT2 family glycosyltransferase